MHLDGRDGHDPHGWPTFAAITFDGEVVNSGDDLDALLYQLADLASDPRHGLEDVTVWREGEECVGVVKTNGRIFRTDGREPVVVSRQTSQEGRSANGKGKRPR